MLARLIREILRKRPAQITAAGLSEIHDALKSGDLEWAGALCGRALRADPDNTDVLHLAGIVAHRQGRREQAIHLLTRAAASETDPQPSLGLGHVLLEAGHADRAIFYFERAAHIEPELYEARIALANALYGRHRLRDAEPHLRKAIALHPDSHEAHRLLAYLLYEQAHHTEAAEAARTMQRIRPADGAKIFETLILPSIYQSTREIEETRQTLQRKLDLLLEGPPLAVTNPVEEIGITPFYLAYHGMNDRDIQRRIAQVIRKAYRPACSAPIARKPHGGRIRVGFISEHFNSHSVGRVNHGLISGLRRDEFEVTVFSLARHEDELARRIRASSDHYVAFDREPLSTIEAAIAERAMDVLIFTDVGMDPLTYFLAYSRLAPLQLVAWGHPDTTGIDTLDYYISADALEIPGADSHYTETLVRLPAWIMPNYQRPKKPQPLRPRSNYGLGDHAHIYVCPQQPFKLHPDFDQAIGAILRGDPKGEVVLVEGAHPNMTELLRRRFHRTIGDVAARVRFLPHMAWPDYLNVIAVSDVMLDPFHFGGANTSYEGLAMGIPVVTLPPPFLRGRHTLGCYLKMEMTDCVARSPQEYADIALRLGTQEDYRRHVVRQIEERSEILFGNGEMARALGDFLGGLVR